MLRAARLARAGAAAAASAFFAAALAGAARQDPAASGSGGGAGSNSCLACHAGIEPMHPEAGLSCVDCHGGDASTTNELQAHVQRVSREPDDERVAPLDDELAWRRFQNPMDLRVVDRTCGTCHEREVKNLAASLHGTTAGHLSDGYYEMGLSKERGSRYSIFPVRDAPRAGGAVSSLVQVPAYRGRGEERDLATHYGDLARKECMQCHLYSEGRATRGRVGFDGDYRGEGCAACHVEYALDGLSESRDRSVARNEPGHPRVHAMTAAPSTQTCTTCHYGDASIGLHFRGLSQLPPGAPGGPDIPGTTDVPLNRVFYLDDPSMVPPDVHHERGMHCIDCHTAADVMGDGRLHGQMEHAVEISCEMCHGTFDALATLRTESGTPLEHVRREGERFVLTSKVTGAEHEIPQAARVVERGHREFQPGALEAMTPRHAKLECYTCHAGWNVNFLGFHFSRNESLTQMDLLTGRRTPGQVTTQEKVFATWKSFYAGLNEKGRVAPYLTGFSTMGSVWNEDGELIVDQQMPVTAAGLSGLTMVHHQLHSTRPTARSCVECHRSSSTWGMGSPNFRLARQLAFVADRRGVEVVALERANLAASVALGKVVLPDVVDLEVRSDPLQGHAQHVFATEGGRGLHVLDVRDPRAPRRVGFVATIEPRGMDLAGDHLYLADGIGGLRVFDVSEPSEPRQVGHVPTFDAHEVAVQWPWAYVADGVGGLAIVDVRAPIAPKLVAGLDVNGDSERPNDATHVAALFQYSRPTAEGGRPSDERTPARNLCVVLDQEEGAVIVDVTEPTHPRILYPRDEQGARTRGGRDQRYRGLALLSHVDVGEEQGGTPTRERDYAYVLAEVGQQNNATLFVFDVTDPERPVPRGSVRTGQSAEMLVPAAVYNPPFLRRAMLVPTEDGLFVNDATLSAEPVQDGVLASVPNAYAVAVEELALDEMLDAEGRRLKDTSHDSRWLYRAEIERVLAVSGAELGTIATFDRPPPIPGATARLHLARLDADRSGLLDGDEVAAAGGASIDANGDGRITLNELAQHTALTGARPATPGTASADGGPAMDGGESRFLVTRVDPDGDLARLFDGVDPFAFDRDGDLALDRGEMSRALFAALDLDGDERLSPAELSRHPGELRQIRYGDALGRALFDQLDRSGDGWITRRELSIAERDFAALDADGDGRVQIVRVQPGELPQRELFGRGTRGEWPTRRVAFSALPPGITTDRVFAALDRDGDGVLSRAELSGRPDLRDELAIGRNDAGATREAVEARVGIVARLGVEATYDDFARRWDLDGDGEVEPDEMPPVSTLAFRGILDD